MAVASSGEKALDAVRNPELPIDLILMDIDLGSGMDGTETAVEILKTHHIPIVFLSSHTEQWWQQLLKYVIRHDPSAIAVLDAELHFMLYPERRLWPDAGAHAVRTDQRPILHHKQQRNALYRGVGDLVFAAVSIADPIAESVIISNNERA